MNIFKSFLCITAAVTLIGAECTSLALEVSADSAVLYDCLTEEYFFEKNADIKRGMASTTKIMTAITAIESTELKNEYTVEYKHTAIEGSKMYLKSGEKVTLEELLYGLMLSSGNDAAIAVADFTGGDMQTFVGMMNDMAKKIGLASTNFENPSGLDGENHYTTAKELAKIADYAMQNEIFRKIVGTKNIKTSNGRYLKNHNKMLWLYEYADGIKTGFTKKCGRCLVSSAVKDGRRLIAVTLNAPDDWNDHINMFDYGFSMMSVKKIVEYGKKVAETYTAGVGKMPLIANDGFEYSITDEEEKILNYEVKADKIIYPPVSAGDPAGTLTIKIGDKIIGEVPLAYGCDVAAPKIEKKGFFRF